MKSNCLTDADIWAAYKIGDEWAISLIYKENAEILYRYGLKFTSEITFVEDTLQDLFAELIKTRRTIGNTDNIKFYLLKSFKRKLLRKLQTEKRYERNETSGEYQFDITWSIEHEIISEEISDHKSKMLLIALNELTPRQKEAIYLRFTKELDYKDIAGLMDISVEACRNLISKAISTLKKWIADKGQNPAVLFVMIFK